MSNSAANSDRNTPSLHLIVFSPSAAVRLAGRAHYFSARGLGLNQACCAGFDSWNARIIAKKGREVKVKWRTGKWRTGRRAEHR
jgi:hypothetical protein